MGNSFYNFMMNRFSGLLLAVAALCVPAARAQSWENNGLMERYDPLEWPKPNLAFTVKSECAFDTVLYYEDMGFDSLVAVIPANSGEIDLKGSLGHKFFAVTTAPGFYVAGQFQLHWNESKPAARGHGASRHFVVVCDDVAKATNKCDDWADTACFEAEGVLKREPIVNPHAVLSEEENRIWHSRRWNEFSRFRMAKEQPPVVHHYTPTGYFVKYRMEDVAPEAWKMTLDYYNQHKDTSKEIVEAWQEDNTYVNHWEVPTTVIHLPQPIKTRIWDDLKPLFGAWVGVPPGDLEGTSVYGVRRYWNGSLLRNHVDRGDVLVVSAILNVEQGDMEEPWALQIYNHDSEPSHVTMEPGDVVLYESAAAIHGRPFPLKGKYYANVFIHTKPKDWTYKGWELKQ